MASDENVIRYEQYAIYTRITLWNIKVEMKWNIKKRKKPVRKKF